MIRITATTGRSQGSIGSPAGGGTPTQVVAAGDAGDLEEVGLWRSLIRLPGSATRDRLTHRKLKFADDGRPSRPVGMSSASHRVQRPSTICYLVSTRGLCLIIHP